LSYCNRPATPPSEILDELQSQLLTLRRGDSTTRAAAFRSFAAYGSPRTLSRHLQRRFGRSRATRSDSGAASPLLEKAAGLVAEKKLAAFAMSGRWISTANALGLLVEAGELPMQGLPSDSTINHRVDALHLLEVRRSHEVIQAAAPHTLHVADTSGSACFKTVDFSDETLVEATPANDTAAQKNHPETLGRHRLYLFAVVDSHSGCLWCEYRACVAPNSWAMADFLLSVWRRSCVPLHLLTDHGAENRGAVENLSRALGVERLNSRPRRPQARGIIERCFRSIFQGFEAPLLMRLGVGTKKPLVELNQRLQEWLGSHYNAEKARLSTSGRVSRYDSSAQGFGLRPVKAGMTVPQVITRNVLPIGRGCIRHAGRLYVPEKPISQGTPVSLLVSGDEVLGIAGDDGSTVKVIAYQMRTGTEYHESTGTRAVNPATWAQALIALGVDDRFITDELGTEGHQQLQARAATMQPDEVLGLLREALP
jgi:transposase InsO family protein